MKKTVSELVKQIDDELTIHDFRMVAGNTHTNLIFDVVVPYTAKMSDDEICAGIKKKISEYNSTYFAVIHVDKDYVR